MKLKQKKFHLFYLIIGLIFPFSGFAFHSAQKVLNVYCNTRSYTTHKRISYINIKSDDKLTLVLPHPAINPNKNLETFEGVFLIKVLQNLGCAIEKSSPMSIIGGDYFVADFNQEDIDNGGMFLGLAQEHQMMPLEKGGAQLMFDVKKLNKHNLSLYKRDSWWVWDIATIILGQPNYNLQIKNMNKKVSLNVYQLSQMQTFSGKLNYPLGIRRSISPKGGIEVASIHLTDLIGKSKKSLNLIMQTMLDIPVRVKAIGDEIIINFKWNNKAIPVAFGGPYQLCIDTQSNQICTYYVKSIEIES